MPGASGVEGSDNGGELGGSPMLLLSLWLKPTSDAAASWSVSVSRTTSDEEDSVPLSWSLC